MPLYQLTPGALADLQEIARYTARQWGYEQAIRYADFIRNGIS